MADLFDTIVVGLGAMGSATAYQLSRRGQRVLGLEAFDAGHQLGSSHGESRIIRLAYFEHADYVPLLRRAYELWADLEQQSGEHLLRLTGGLMIGPPAGALIGGAAGSARTHNLEHEMLDAAEIRRRYPALNVLDSDVALWEPRAGILSPERCLATHVGLAKAAGARIHYGEPLRSWTASADGVEVVTEQGTYRAAHAVFTCGAWLAKVLPDLAIPLQPERIPLFWMQPVAHPEWFSLGHLPIYLWELGGGEGHFYGFPHLEWPGVKVARHHSGEACDPDSVNRTVTPRDEQRLRDVLARCIPALNGSVVHRLVCMYENTPDEHFVIDRHPEFAHVVYAGGFSGHGFKFSSVVGEILADLVIDGRATPNADFLKASRLGLASPAPLG
jgi:sarcosine oxidase